MKFRNTIPFSVLFFLLCGALQSHAKQQDSIWNQANRLYSQHQYDSAATMYRELLDDSFKNAAIYYNLGNTYYRLNDYPNAILYYERALWLNKTDQKIKDNLLLSKAKIQNSLTEIKPIFFLVWWKNLIDYFDPGFWAILSFCLFVAFLTGIYFKWVKKKTPPYFERWLAAVVLFFLISTIILYASTRAKNINTKAIVMNERSPVFVDKKSSDTDIYAPAGTTVKIRGKTDSQFYVSLPNGAKGWISSSDIEKVVND